MGEYAIRKKDGVRIKIGTCERMYYARYEQLKDIEYEYPTDNLFWRIPTPNEDGIEVGDYNDWRPFDNTEFKVPFHLSIDDSKFNEQVIDFMQNSNGIVQLKDEQMGLLANFHCPHGFPIEKLREGNKANDKRIVQDFFYNGHRSPLFLSSFKNTEHDLLVVVECCCCHSMWSFSFDEIEPAIRSLWMKLRLFHQCTDYWCKHNKDSHTPWQYQIKAMSYHHTELRILFLNDETYMVEEGDDNILLMGSWEECRNAFISMLPRPCEVSNEDEIMCDYAADGAMMMRRYLPNVNINKRRKIECNTKE